MARQPEYPDESYWWVKWNGRWLVAEASTVMIHEVGPSWETEWWIPSYDWAQPSDKIQAFGPRVEKPDACQ